MLLELQIEHFALIESAHLEFREGLNVLTGETGAGKSIILDALGFLLGDPARDSLQSGERRARVTGRFVLSPEAREWLAAQGWDDEEEAIALREMSAGGRSLCRLNGRLCSLGQLKELGNLLLEIHGQHQSNRLLRPSRHLELLDRLCGQEHLSRLERFRELYRRRLEVLKSLEELGQAERERNRQLEWLRFEVQEIEEAALSVEEEQQLESRIRRLAASEELGLRARQALELLNGEGGAVDQLGQAHRQLLNLSRFDPEVPDFAGRCTVLESELQELSHSLDDYATGLAHDPIQLDQLQTRSEQIRSLQRKYGSDIAAVLSYGQEARRKLEDLENLESRRESLHGQQLELTRELETIAPLLGLQRRQQSRLLEAEVKAQLQDLNLASMRFLVEPSESELNPHGSDRLEFFLAPNPGTPPRPLTKIASGGELSRLMLAIISIFAKFEPLTTLIFDEIDAGLGGRAAEAVARKLGQLARQRQVLCVTHLAVIAAAADCHIAVTKVTDTQATRLQLVCLDSRQREQEIARMLSGDAGARASHELARELLENYRSPA